MFITGILEFVSSLGSTSIEVHEWDEPDVRKLRLDNSPSFSKLTKKLTNLQFSGWSLAHAVVKADYLDQRNLTMPGIGFLLQASNLIDFAKSPIQLRSGASKVLNDFSGSSLSGRVAQGFAILYGHSLGLKFSAHLSSHVAKMPSTSPAAIHKNDSMADFLFAGNAGGTVLIESKGSFTSQKNDPTAIKSVLKSALTKQIDPWMLHIQPAPTNGYVVYSCLREDSWEASSLFVVDPIGEDVPTANLHFDREQVMRENYGAWLRAMGLKDVATRLIDGAQALIDGAQALNSEVSRTEAVEIEFLVLEHQGRSFAFPAVSHLRQWPCFPWEAPMLGIDITVLHAISTVIENRVKLSEILVDLPERAVEQGGASVFPDGSFFGMVLSDGGLQFEVIKL